MKFKVKLKKFKYRYRIAHQNSYRVDSYIQYEFVHEKIISLRSDYGIAESIKTWLVQLDEGERDEFVLPGVISDPTSC